jgi:undecaprenyl-diphosphatase
VFYGLLACYLVRRVRTWPARAAILAACVALVMLVALSRMSLGVHFVSDVLAAAAEGAAWLAICITAVSTLHRRRLARGETSWSERTHAAEDLG